MGLASRRMAIGSPRHAAPASSGGGGGGGGGTTPTLLFREDFTSLDMTTSSHQGRWRPNDSSAGGPNSITSGYQDFGNPNTWDVNPTQVLGGSARTMFTQSGSELMLTAMATPTAWRTDIGAANGANGGNIPATVGCILITNTDVQTFGYGYYEFKMALPSPGKGMFPSMWLYAARGANPGTNKGGAEIDLLEIFGYGGASPFNTTLHTAPDGGSGSLIGDDAVAITYGNTTTYHIYGLDWTDSYMRFYKDGVLIGQATQAMVEWFRGLRMDIRLNYTMDASFFGSTEKSDSTTPNPLTMVVDYIYVYDSKPATAGTGGGGAAVLGQPAGGGGGGGTGTTAPPATLPSYPGVGGKTWTKTFEDLFPGNSLNPEWIPNRSSGPLPTNQSTNNPSIQLDSSYSGNIQVNNGLFMSISAQVNPGSFPDKPFCGAHLSPTHGYQTPKSYVEVLMRVTSRGSNWPALSWYDIQSGGTGGELDWAEWTNTQSHNGSPAFNIWRYNYQNQLGQQYYNGEPGLAHDGQFHLYGMFRNGLQCIPYLDQVQAATGGNMYNDTGTATSNLGIFIDLGVANNGTATSTYGVVIEVRRITAWNWV